MRHELAREKLLDLAYGELPAAEAAEVEAHLATCATCRAEADGIEATRRTMRALPPEEPPQGEGILLAAARQAADRARPTRASFLFWLRPALGAAVVVAVVGVSWKLIGPGVERAVDVEANHRAAAPLAPAPTAPAGETAARAETAAAPAAGAGAAAGTAPASADTGVVGGAVASGRVESAKAVPPPAPAKAAKARAVAAEPEAKAEADAEAIVAALEKDGRARAVALPKAAPAELRQKMAQQGLADSVRPAAVPPAPAAPAPRAATRALGAEEAPAQGPLGEAEDMVRDLRLQRDEGKLNEARRRPDPCPGGDLERVAWFDGWGKARRLARTGPLPAGMGEGEATRDQYYDADGRLRLVHLHGTGPEGRFARRIVLDAGGRRLLEDPPGKGPWPAADLALADPAAAFWAPQRCGK